MSFIAIPQCSKSTIKMDVDGTIVTSGIWMLTGTALVASAAQDDVNSLGDAWVAHIMPLFSDLVSCISIDLIDHDVPDGAVATAASGHGPGSVGASTTAPTALSLAGIVNLSTGLSGRKHHGHLSLAGISQADLFDVPTATLAGASVTAWNGAFASFLSELSSGAGPWVVASKAGGVGSSAAVTSATMAARMGSQRRRLHRV